MSIEAIAAVGSQFATALPAVTPATDVNAIALPTELLKPAAGEGVFGQLVDTLSNLDARMQANSRATTELALGQSENLHQIMIDSERTRLQFDLAMSMRNRVLEAYQEIMRMQV